MNLIERLSVQILDIYILVAFIILATVPRYSAFTRVHKEIMKVRKRRVSEVEKEVELSTKTKIKYFFPVTSNIQFFRLLGMKWQQVVFKILGGAFITLWITTTIMRPLIASISPYVYLWTSLAYIISLTLLVVAEMLNCYYMFKLFTNRGPIRILAFPFPIGYWYLGTKGLRRFFKDNKIELSGTFEAENN